MYQDNTRSPASSSGSDAKAKLKMKIQQMIEQRRGGKNMASPASVSTSASMPIVEPDNDIAKLEDVAHADGDDDYSVCSETVSDCSSIRPTTSPLSQMQGLIPATYKAPQTAVENKSKLLAILPVIFHCQFDGLQS